MIYKDIYGHIIRYILDIKYIPSGYIYSRKYILVITRGFFLAISPCPNNNEARPVMRCLHPPRAGCQGYRGRSPAGAIPKTGKIRGKIWGKYGKSWENMGKIWKTRNQTGKPLKSWKTRKLAWKTWRIPFEFSSKFPAKFSPKGPRPMPWIIWVVLALHFADVGYTL